MRQEFRLEFSNGYPMLVESGNRLLLDLGSPFSFGVGRNCAISLGGVSHILPHYAGGACVRNAVGDVQGLLGTDLLRGHALLLDYSRSLFVFDYDGPMLQPLPSQFREGRYLFSINISGVSRKVVLDTGVPYAYLMPQLVPHSDHDEIVREESFKGPLCQRGNEQTVGLMGREWSMWLGEMAVSFIIPIRALGADGVLGKDVLDRFAISIDPQGRLYADAVRR